MPEKILLVDSDQATLSFLKNKFQKAGYSVDTVTRGDLAWSKIHTDPPDVVILELALPDMSGVDLIRRVRQDSFCRSVGLFVLSSQVQPEDIAASLDAGAEQYIIKRPGSDVELIARIRARKAQTKKGIVASAAAPLGHLFAFCSAKGGSGTTSVCINTAYALAKLAKNQEVVIVDMVLPIGTVGLSLGFKSDFTIARLNQLGITEIEPSLLKKYVSSQLPWGFRVLLGSNNPSEASAITPDAIGELFQTLRRTYDYVLVDLGRMLSRISLPIFEMATGILLIATPDMSTVRSTRVIADYLQSRNISRDHMLLVNNRTVGRVWTTTEDIEREIQLTLRETIPFEVEHMTMAVNESVPFMEKFPQNAASIAFTELARQLVKRAQQPQS